MQVKILYDGTLSWYRTDSYWDAGSYRLASTWGPGIRLSAHFSSGDDGNGASNLGKTYVFAYSDGSGVQLNHLSFNTAATSSHRSGGLGRNTLTTAKSSFTNETPDTYEESKCVSSNLLLEGT